MMGELDLVLTPYTVPPSLLAYMRLVHAYDRPWYRFIAADWAREHGNNAPLLCRHKPTIRNWSAKGPGLSMDPTATRIVPLRGGVIVGGAMGADRGSEESGYTYAIAMGQCPACESVWYTFLRLVHPGERA